MSTPTQPDPRVTTTAEDLGATPTQPDPRVTTTAEDLGATPTQPDPRVTTTAEDLGVGAPDPRVTTTAEDLAGGPDPHDLDEPDPPAAGDIPEAWTALQREALGHGYPTVDAYVDAYARGEVNVGVAGYRPGDPHTGFGQIQALDRDAAESGRSLHDHLADLRPSPVDDTDPDRHGGGHSTSDHDPYRPDLEALAREARGWGFDDVGDYLRAYEGHQINTGVFYDPVGTPARFQQVSLLEQRAQDAGYDHLDVYLRAAERGLGEVDRTRIELGEEARQHGFGSTEDYLRARAEGTVDAHSEPNDAFEHAGRLAEHGGFGSIDDYVDPLRGHVPDDPFEPDRGSLEDIARADGYEDLDDYLRAWQGGEIIIPSIYVVPDPRQALFEFLQDAEAAGYDDAGDYLRAAEHDRLSDGEKHRVEESRATRPEPERPVVDEHLPPGPEDGVGSGPWSPLVDPEPTDLDGHDVDPGQIDDTVQPSDTDPDAHDLDAAETVLDHHREEDADVPDVLGGRDHGLDDLDPENTGVAGGLDLGGRARVPDDGAADAGGFGSGHGGVRTDEDTDRDGEGPDLGDPAATDTGGSEGSGWSGRDVTEDDAVTDQSDPHTDGADHGSSGGHGSGSGGDDAGSSPEPDHAG